MAGEYLPPVITRLTAELDDLVAKIEQAKALIKSLNGTTVEIEFKIDTRSLARARTYARQLVDALGTLNIPVGFDLNNAQVMKLIAAMGAGRAAGGGGGGFGWGLWGLGAWAAANPMALLHFFEVFGGQLVADTVGFAAWAAAGAHAIGVIQSNWATAATTFGTMNAQERVGFVTLQNFTQQMGAMSDKTEPLFFASMNAGLALVRQNLKGFTGITNSASLAMLDFFHSMSQNFQSPSWQRLLGDTMGNVRQDMDMFGQTLKNVINLIPAVVHNFNFLGLGVMGGINLILRGLTNMGNAGWTLVRFASLAHLAFIAARWMFATGSRATGFTWGLTEGAIGSTIVAPTMRAIAAIRTAWATSGVLAGLGGLGGEFGMLGRGGRLVAFGEQLTGISAAAMGVGASLGVAAGAIGLAWMAAVHAKQPVDTLTAALARQDNATGANIVGYQKLAAQLKTYDNLGHVAQVVGRVGPSRSAINQVDAAYQTLDAHQRQAAMTAQTLSSNFGYLQSRFGLTRLQAYQTAQAVGLLGAMGKRVFTAADRANIASYVAQMRAAQNPLTQIAFDMQGAANATLSLQQRLQDLTGAFNAGVGPFAQMIQDQVTFKQATLSLDSALQKSRGSFSLQTAAGRTARTALGQQIQATQTLSQDTLNSTHSFSTAAGYIYREIGILEALHSKSSVVAQAIAYLRQMIDSLRSKTININAVINYSTTGAAGLPVSGSTYHSVVRAQGVRNSPPGWAIVGDQGPELVRMGGGERVYPSGTGPAGGAPMEIHNHIYLDGKELFTAVKRQTYNYNTKNGNRDKAGRVRGVVTPR